MWRRYLRLKETERTFIPIALACARKLSTMTGFDGLPGLEMMPGTFAPGTTIG
jgi:hypothetical protein